MDGRTAAATLGVDRHASKDELRRAFRARAKELHPDANPRGSASDFIALRRAFDVLLTTAPDGPSRPAAARPARSASSTSPFEAWSAAPAPTIDLADAPVRPARSRPAAGIDRRPRDHRGLTFEDHLVAALARS